MNPLMRILIILLCVPFIILAIHMLLARIFRNSPPQIVVIKSAFLGYLPTALLLWNLAFYSFSSLSEIMISALFSFIIYNAFAYTYFQFFNTTETARRIRVIYEIYNARFLSIKDITNLYKTSDIINLRLKRLVGLKQLKFTDGYYLIERKTLYYAALAISLWRNILGFNKSS